MGGRAFGPPLCRGCAPATPPSKTIPRHRRTRCLPNSPTQRPFKARAVANRHQSPSRPPTNPPANPRTRANHSPSRKSPKSQFRQIPSNPPTGTPRACPHPIPGNPSIPIQSTRQSPRQPPHARKSQSITKIPKITVQTGPPNHSLDQANCIKNRDIIALYRITNRHF